MRAIRVSYLAFLFFNLTDILSSLGAQEANPLMRDSFGVFVWWKAIIVKTVVLGVLAVMSGLFYEIGKVWDKRAGEIAAALVPCYFTWELMHVTFLNVFGRWFS